MKVVLRVTKAIILIVLLAFFYYYFFLDVFTKFKSRRTNVATREELYKKEGTIKGIKSPAITVCLSPSLKSSVLKKYNLTSLTTFQSHSQSKFKDLNLTFSALLQEAAFRLNHDYEIKIGSRYLPEAALPLKIGNNQVDVGDEGKKNIEVQEIQSPMFGFCVLIMTNFTLGVHEHYPFSIRMKENVGNSYPVAHLYFTSRYDYLGVVSGVWRNLKPCKVEVNFAHGTTIIDLKETRRTFVECDEFSPYHSFHDCFAKKFQGLLPNSKCLNRCSSIIFQAYEVYLNKTLFERECTLEEEKCLFGTNGILKNMLHIVDECPLQCNLTQYIATLTHSGNINMDEDGLNSADFILLSGSNSITVNEEYWVYDTTGLIGAIGGSLGLFAGFSFFDCICLILNWIYTKTIEN